jgi:hypothetical protein
LRRLPFFSPEKKRACEPQLGLERERGQGGADEADGGAEKQLEAGSGPGQRQGESLVDGVPLVL